MPIEKEILERKKTHSDDNRLTSCLLYRVKDLGREVIVLEGDDPMALGSAFKRFLEALKKVLLHRGGAHDEYRRVP